MRVRIMAAVSLLAAALFSRADPLRNFTVADDIGLATFEDFVETITWSPDRQYFAVKTQRGIVSANRVEGELRIYRVSDVAAFVNGKTPSAEPVWTVRESNSSEGPVIQSPQWLSDSSSLAYLARSSDGRWQLKLIDLQKRKVEALTPETQNVICYAIRDRMHFAYQIPAPGIVPGEGGPYIVGTGKMLAELLLPSAYPGDRTELWAARNGEPFQVRNPVDHSPIVSYLEGRVAFSLSPLGDFLVTVLPVKNIPEEWEILYPPDMGSVHKSGHQNLSAPHGFDYSGTYVSIELETGKVFDLTGTPTSRYATWVATGAASPTWSDDGNSVLLPGTYLPQRPHPEKAGAAQPEPPCIALTDRRGSSIECVAPLGSYRTSDMNVILKRLRFEANRSDRVIVEYLNRKQNSFYIRSAPGKWTLESERASSPTSSGLTVATKQGLNDPPVLLATDDATHRSAIVWDPNPQLKQVRLGEASVYRWKDRSGRDWIAGLYKPVDYVPGHRYPLVIQNHGFNEDRFIPSGIYPTGFAARELAAAGIAVLQVNDCPVRLTVEEGPCQVAGYESAVEKLVSEGIADPDRVGIIGFSRTCYYTLEALTMSKLKFKAASITDGVNGGYLQYIAFSELSRREKEALNGAPPFGEGLQQWLRRAPSFNMDRVTAPLQVVATGKLSILEMWEPYALLSAMKKPADFIFIDSSGHPLSNPQARLASQGSSVDWFRFWLLNEKDPDPAKVEQYKRWEAMR
jgi:dipeptidyl aminopeptidase/acylaminoacyl peptidase